MGFAARQRTQEGSDRAEGGHHAERLVAPEILVPQSEQAYPGAEQQNWNQRVSQPAPNSTRSLSGHRDPADDDVVGGRTTGEGDREALAGVLVVQADFNGVGSQRSVAGDGEGIVVL